ncbi:hypothetical protein ENUP19_0121G0097 [Entamoeba nuttalli]|uniref:Molybdenum cofactor sulfurase, putative n=2 Tax=Entamoeba nuttalli TaxID=412467 RepID=K2GZC9_ENTNP|nr:molybdenum cofactor sulfurase, putative [Entamoeba nuttalli P19]EKE39272.1 molybdenum cofactor sulfurase, putative [Entamoeba nuttalli P19]|eukprot:XP_008858392.1 molybdenum cofactor sulfurase, putative [Entamoeba nuttalli P19]
MLQQRPMIDLTRVFLVVAVFISFCVFISFLNNTLYSSQVKIEKSDILMPLMNDEIYFDYAGAAPYTIEQIDQYSQFMKNNFLCNSHSPNVCGLRSSELVQNTRDTILKYFNAQDDYIIIFTSGCTHALRVVGESFPFEEGSQFIFTKSNHNSVLGIREFAKLKNASFLSVDEYSSSYLKTSIHPSLFAFPAEDNFNGVQYPLEWIEDINKHENWYSLIDAAAFVSHSLLDLSQVKPHFVTLSFYKIFGFPMGIGALLMRKDVVDKMSPIYFGGGTVYASLPNVDYHVFFGFSSKFEAGTLPISSIVGIKYGFEMIKKKGGIKSIQKHVKLLTQKLVTSLKQTKFENGNPVFEIYGNHFKNSSLQGGIITFNIHQNDNSLILTASINSFLREKKINIRTGCMCNPGSCLKSLGINEDEYMNDIPKQPKGGFDSNSCLDIMVGNKEAGAIRVSLGYASTEEEIERLIEVLNEYFKENQMKIKIPIK